MTDAINQEPVSITLEFTPNPNTLKFVVNRTLVEKGAANFTEIAKATHSPLAQKLFQVAGVQAVMIGNNFVTITKSQDGNWDTLAEEVPRTIEIHLAKNEPVVLPAYFEEQSASQGASGDVSAVEQKIREILDTEIRPAVAMDGGDILFGRYEDGIVYLHLQGSCSSCPSSVATLKMGVETRLKDVIPEIREVVQV